jgi:hypothetical protein
MSVRDFISVQHGGTILNVWIFKGGHYMVSPRIGTDAPLTESYKLAKELGKAVHGHVSHITQSKAFVVTKEPDTAPNAREVWKYA